MDTEKMDTGKTDAEEVDTDDLKILLHHSDTISSHVKAIAKVDMTQGNNIITAKKAKEAGYASEGTITMSFRLKAGYSTATLCFDVVKALLPKTHHHVILGKPSKQICDKYKLSRRGVYVIEDVPSNPEQMEAEEKALELKKQERQDQKDKDLQAGRARRAAQIAKAKAITAKKAEAERYQGALETGETPGRAGC